MKFGLHTFAVVLVAAGIAGAQTVPLAKSHGTAQKSAKVQPPPAALLKPAVRVNGAVITEADVTREMYTIFPYAQQHSGGFPKDLEPEIRRGAIEMIVFEELLYQEAKRRNLSVSPSVLAQAEKDFRRQFPSKAMFDDYLQAECKGSVEVMREKIRRAMLIDRMMKAEVDRKSVVTVLEVREYYKSNPKQFEKPETFSIQTISIIPPEGANAAIQAEAKAKIKDIVRLGRAAKTSRDFGLIAEQLSEDDWRMKLGDRGAVDVSKLPPEVVSAARNMKIGEVSEPVQLGRAWVVFRLNGHSAAGHTPFADVQAKLRKDLQANKRLAIRSALKDQLSKGAKIEVL